MRELYLHFKKGKRQMKKLKLIAAVLTAMIMTGGCGQSKNAAVEKPEEASNEIIQLTVWGSEKDQALLTEMIDSFKAAYIDQATFDISFSVVEEGKCKDVILEDVGNTADVFAFADDQLMALAAAGVVEEIEDAELIKDENLQGAIEAASINDKLYAYPMTADNGYFMFYNKKYLSEEDVRSLDQMLEVAASVNKKVTMDFSSAWYTYSFFGNTGLKITLNEDGITNDCDWNSTTGEIKGKDVGNAMLKIAQHPGFASKTDDEFVVGVKDGSIVAGVSGIWNIDSLQAAWGNDLAAVKLPTYTCAGKQVQMASFAGYKMAGVNSYSDQKEWAAKFADWITNEENQRLRFEERGLGPSRSKVAESDEIKKSPGIQALIEQSEFASLQRVGGDYWAPVTAFGEALTAGNASESNMQALMDTMVKGITVKVTER